jgi:transcriptional regulator with XRE-family HTH domain
MKLDNLLTDETILRELAGRLARIRLERNQTQAQLAELAGIALRTVRRLERGQSIQLAGFVRVLRALDLIARLDAMIPEPIPSPLAQVKLEGKKRRRASTRKPAGDSAKTWTWGDRS